MNAVEHQRKSDHACLDCLLHGAILLIEAPHEADLDEPFSERGFRIEDCRTIGFGGRHWLLAEDRLAGPDRREHISCVRVSPRCDDDRVDFALRR